MASPYGGRVESPRSTAQSFLSLERKLPILIGGLVACVLLATLALVYVELRDSAIDASSERLSTVANQLAELSRPGPANRIRQVNEVAARPEIVALVRGDSSARLAAIDRLEPLRVPVDSMLPIQILAADGTVLARHGGVPALTVSEDSLAPPELTDSAALGRFLQHGDKLFYWTTAPVRHEGRTIGHVAQLRSVTTGAVGEQIENLIGNETEVFFGSAEGGPWAALQGGILSDVPPVDSVGGPFFQERNGERYYAHALPVAGTPWLVIAETPWASVIAGSNEVVRRVAIVGLLLMLLGGIAAWLVSRSVTRPLRELGRAADAIARGDYSRRTGLTRADEIGRVARSFDAMAGHVDATHAELERRFEHAQRLAAELEVARLEAMEASRAKSHFLATMSHEIRTPINAVIGYTDLLDAGVAGELPPAQRNYVDRIKLSSEHLITVVNDVLDFAKIESGQMRMAPATHAAATSIASALAILHARAVTRSIDVRTSCGPDISYHADPHRVQQILLNLLSNALKFSPEGGAVDVACDARSSRGHAASGNGTRERLWTCITVTDRGPGIAPDQLESIFEPFIQGNAGYTRSHGGTGLGLAIARSLARMMNGDLTVDSLPGAGAAFTLWLPQKP